MLERLGCDFHHLGVACRDLDAEEQSWAFLGYRRDTADFHDPRQKVSGRFLVGPGPRLELLVGTSQESPVAAMVRQGIKLYHHAYVTERFDETVGSLRSRGIKLVSGPMPAVAFDGCKIAFFMTPTMNLIEIIERKRQ
jgi:methylmalonyl-CoA/ethylmalonyl-CoA epimerase